MLNKQLVNRKLISISQYLDELRDISKVPLKVFENEYLHYAAERLIELTVEMAIDINFHIIKETTSIPPKDFKESFLELGKMKILPQNFAKRISASAGLRNLLVHHYVKVDLQKLYKDLKSGINDYEKYCTYIKKFIH